MSESTESNRNIWGNLDVQETVWHTHSFYTEEFRLNEEAKLEHDPLSDFKIQEECSKTQLKILPKLEGESPPTDPLNIAETLLISKPVALKNSKNFLSQMKEEISANFDVSSECSEVICPTISTAASPKIEINRPSPVVVLERLPFPTTCLETINADISSSQILDYVKNRRQNPIRTSGIRNVIRKYTRPTFSIGDESKNSMTEISVKNVGSGELKLYVCEECHISYKNKRNLKIHIITHMGAIQYSCGQCNKPFSRKDYLKRHMIIHTGEKQHTCGQCNKSFSRKDYLETHIITHTGEKRHACGQCNKSFNQKAHLKTHMVTHTGEKRHTYGLCNKSFSLKGNLKTHMITHTGEKHHTCGQCSKSFGHKSDLNTHIITHTREKPYRCRHCNKSFCRKCDLKTHTKTHTG